LSEEQLTRKLVTIDCYEFARVRPILDFLYELSANWIFTDVIPFLRVTSSLLERWSKKPRCQTGSCDVPVAIAPPRTRFNVPTHSPRLKSSGPVKQMNVIWKNHVTTDRDSKFPMRPVSKLD